MSTISDLEWAELLHLPAGMAVQMCLVSASQLTVRIFCSEETSLCPHCHTPSQRIHSHYGRTVADLPVSGRQVKLLLKIRKFICSNSACEHKIFTERLDELVKSHARMTKRLAETLQILGFATCGELGERLAPKLGMQVSGPTVLRLMRTHPYTPPESVTILGIDDWAWKKGVTYGTILVDLQSRKPIELLSDRTSETAEAWLRGHPEVEIVSRDRGGNYALAARSGAPQAQQVADKFHLLKSLRERLKDLTDRRHSCLPAVEEIRSDAIPAKAQGMMSAPDAQTPEISVGERHYRTIPPTPYQRPEGVSYQELKKQGRREKRLARYQDIKTLSAQGISIHEIARRLKMNRVTVRRFLSSDEFPEIPRRGPKGSMLNDYKPYLLQRWQQGCRNGEQLYDEIKARGYPGSAALLRCFLADLRKKHREVGSVEGLIFDTATQEVGVASDAPPKRNVTRRMSSARASWLMVSQQEKLDTKQQKYIEQICQAHPDLERAYHLAQEFVTMLATHRAADLDAWLVQAEQSNLPEFKEMAIGIRLDYAAVSAAFSSEWSNGQVEAQVHCLKLQKRIVFGRANFDLLRLRVLCRV